jgi:hypothetical protein
LRATLATATEIVADLPKKPDFKRAEGKHGGRNEQDC